MDLKNIFKRGKKVSWRKFRSNRLKSPMMRDLFGTNIKDNSAKDENQKKLAKIFDRKDELVELNLSLCEKSEGGLTKTEMKEVIGGLKTLTEKERYEFAKVVFPSAPSGKRFIRPSENTNQNSASENTSAGRQSSFIRYKPKKVSAQTTSSPAKGVASLTPTNMATIMNRIRENGEESSENEGNDQPKGDFSRALDAMRKTKRS